MPLIAPSGLLSLIERFRGIAAGGRRDNEEDDQKLAEFKEACIAGRTASALRNMPGDPDQTIEWDQDMVTGLYLAAAHGHEEIVRGLAERNADPGWVDADGRSALFWAAKRGPSMARLLVGLGADVLIQTPTGETPLHIADQPLTIEFFIQSGVSPNAIGEHKWRPVHFLLALGKGPECLDMLCRAAWEESKEADIWSREGEGGSVLSDPSDAGATLWMRERGSNII